MFENKRKFPLWVRPETLEKVEEIYREDNCRSRSEFIEKAIEFYYGYLTSRDKGSYLPSVVTSTLKSIVAEGGNRQDRMLFKLAVELALGHKHLDTTIQYLGILDERLMEASREFYARHSAGYGIEKLL